MAAKSSSRGWWIVAAVLVVAVAVAAVVVIATTGGSDSAGAVTLEPANTAGTDPFTDSVAIGPAAAFPSNVEATVVAARNTLPVDPKTHVRVATASAPGLYGGSGDKHVCNPQQLVAFLSQHPDKAAAWAAVLGIAPANIASYVGTLTPVVLTSDTLVTNHGYRNGRATVLQSVLQAGTAVMVDRTGTPRVKCNCGNPLTPPAVINPTHYRGTRWPGYAPTQVTIIKSGPTTINNITVINIQTGATYTQATGSGGTGNGLFVAAAYNVGTGSGGGSTTISTSNDGTSWSNVATLPGNVGGEAWGNDKWLALRKDTGRTTSVLESTDLRTWQPFATIPSYAYDLAYNNGTWLAVGGVVTGTDELAGEFPTGAVYSSTDGHTWNRVAVVNGANAFRSVAYGNGMWVAIANGIHEGGQPSTSYTSTDGTTWTKASGNTLDHEVSLGNVAFGNAKWVLGGMDNSPPALSGNGAPGGVILTSSDAAAWTPQRTAPISNSTITGLAYGNGRFLAAGQQGDILSSTDATSWSTRGHTQGAGQFGNDDLAFGGNASTSAPATTPTTVAPTPTTAAQTASSLQSVDWKNYTYKELGCGDENKQVKLTNGQYVQTITAGIQCGTIFTAVDFADVTGDGKPEAIVNLMGNSGGNALIIDVAVFTDGPNGPQNLGYIVGQSFPPYSGSVVVWLPHFTGSEARCCPSQQEKDTYTYSNGTFVKSGTTYVPANQLPTR